MIKKPLAQIISETETCFPTIFSKEDVLLILNSIENEEIFIPEEKIEELKDELKEAIERMETDETVDFDSAEFGVKSGNEIILEDLVLHMNNIGDTIEKTLNDFFAK